jgi:hypothetical protein
LLAALHDWHGVFKLFDGDAHDGIDDGQIIRSIRETDLLVFPVFLNSLIQFGRTLIDNVMSASNSGGNNDFRHGVFLLPFS